MTLTTYLKNRTVFELRYKPNEFGQCFIIDMKKGIRNFDLFFNLYGHDRRIVLSSNTYGVDRKPRFKVIFKNYLGSKIVISDKTYSMFEKFPDSFDKLQKQIKQKTNH